MAYLNNKSNKLDVVYINPYNRGNTFLFLVYMEHVQSLTYVLCHKGSLSKFEIFHIMQNTFSSHSTNYTYKKDSLKRGKCMET